MKKLLAFLVLSLPGLSQIITPIPSSNSLKSSVAIINSNFTNLNLYKGNVFSGAGAPGSIPLSVLGSKYVDTTNVLEYTCFNGSGACTAVGSNNWVLYSPGGGSVTNFSISGPSWLTWTVLTPTTTPVVSAAPTTGQTIHQVIGTCGTATSFGPCSLVASDLPSTAVSPGTYQAATVVVDQQGRLTSASSSIKARGSVNLGTAAIASTACAAVVSASAPGVTTSDMVLATFSADPTATTGYIPSTNGILTIFVYPTANNVNFKVCNLTAASVTPGAVTINYRAE